MKKLIHAEAIKELDLNGLLEKISKVKIGILGDLCLDVYWHADMRQSELSRETPHYPLPVVEERFSLGGAANVCANAAALGADVTAVGVIGSDWRGAVMEQCCKEQKIRTDYLVHEEGRFTNAYCKPMRHGISEVVYEDPRLDFCTLETIREETEEKLLEKLQQLDVDILCVSDQLKYGCITPKIREQIMSMAENGLKVIADSRDRIGLYTGVYLKPNEIEGYRAVYGKAPESTMDVEEYTACAEELAQKNHAHVFMTLGGQGCVSVSEEGVSHMTAAKTPEKIDFVGAGDTMLASLSLALAAGATAEEAMAFANLCASITIGKIGMTGTASPQEVLAAAGVFGFEEEVIRQASADEMSHN